MVPQQSLPEDGLQLPSAEPVAVPGTGRGCFFRGCLSIGVVLLLLLLALGGCVYLKYRELFSLTEESPVVFDELEDRGKRIVEIRNRLETFRRQSLKDEAELLLAVEELNLLLLEHRDPAIAEYARFQRIRTVDKTLFVDISLPVDWLNSRLKAVKDEFRKEGREFSKDFQVAESLFGLLQGRYFNAAAEVGVDPAKNPPGFVIRSIKTVAGKLLPLEGAAPGRLDGELEGISEQALSVLLGEASANVKSLEIRPGSIFLRGGP